MIQLDIKVVTVRKFTHYRSKQAVNSEFKNLVNQHFSAEKRLSDITYIHTVKHGWTYLASILDVCTRKIVAYSYGRKMDRFLVISALEKAWKSRNYPKNIILHSDLGSQYTSLPQIEWALYFLTAKKAVLLIMLLMKYKKSTSHILKTTEDKIKFINNLKEIYDIRLLCKVVKLHHSVVLLS